jgi:hypothetical protein
VATIISYVDDSERPRAEIVLANGDRIHVALDRDGLAIRQVQRLVPSRVLFQADPSTVSHLCAGLIPSPDEGTPTPLQILVSAIVQLPSADLVARAFREAAARIE